MPHSLDNHYRPKVACNRSNVFVWIASFLSKGKVVSAIGANCVRRRTQRRKKLRRISDFRGGL